MITVKTYRGHIRNHEQLCTELNIDRTLPRAEKEEAILARAYETWGHEMADHIYGMFAFALYDDEADELFCLRDQ
ncbi:MAG: asparagine synthetase B, partial [Lachnospiraceae bacterium]|nr:asparagine synthetase B [Lachnospiraceae bacterium]